MSMSIVFFGREIRCLAFKEGHKLQVFAYKNILNLKQKGTNEKSRIFHIKKLSDLRTFIVTTVKSRRLQYIATVPKDQLKKQKYVQNFDPQNC